MFYANGSIGELSGTFLRPELHGVFLEHLGRCIYDGLWVGEDSSIENIRGIRKDITDAFRAARIPVIRWPGGCFASSYHWMDGIGPRAKRPLYENNNLWHSVESNQFGTHEFFEFSELIGAKAYLAANIASGTPKEMCDWIEYLHGDAQTAMGALRTANGHAEPWEVAYWGLDNETWGGGGNMRPEYYADVAQRFLDAALIMPYFKDMGKVFVGAHRSDYAWTRTLMKAISSRDDFSEAGDFDYGLSLHCYTYGGEIYFAATPAVDFTAEQWANVMWGSEHYDQLLSRHGKIMDQYDPEKKVKIVFDEWGTWYASVRDRLARSNIQHFSDAWFLEQQNTLRDAVFTARCFDVFHRHAERLGMAMIAQGINVLQALVLTERESMVLTPTYHVFSMYAPHMGAQRRSCDVSSPALRSAQGSFEAISISASQKEDTCLVTLSNADMQEDCKLKLSLPATPETIEAQILDGPAANACNTFAAPKSVAPIPFEGFEFRTGALEILVPAHSVISISIRLNGQGKEGSK